MGAGVLTKKPAMHKGNRLTPEAANVTFAPVMGMRRRYLLVCVNRRPPESPKGSCAHRGSEAVYEALKTELRTRKLAAVEARACSSSCLDQCTSGPVILVEPDHYFYGRVTVEDVPAIADALERGERVERLVLTPEDLARG